VRIHCIGGGPAGLYLAILLKKQDAGHEIRVIERNAPNDTFGWGVVFSDETLGNFLEADEPTAREITRAFVHWTDIDVHYRDQVARSTGHGFSGMSRKRLLNILQARAAELGVEVEYKREVDSLDEWKSADLVVAADGINSIIRRTHEDWFGPSIDGRKCRYMWLGTDRPLDAFTFVFRESPHGLFQVHAYPFEAGTGTFIVECHEDVWRRAGLDRATEAESLAFCSELFAPELEGHRLLSNASKWIQFSTVKNARWHHDNVVLLGDAAHTAHFSIGSGTKLAMEDAIELARALEVERDVPSALATYEAVRRPMVERIQRAAQRSLEWFEDSARYTKQEPDQFLFGLMTRSLRITHENLRLRDPALVERVDRWLMAQASVKADEVVPPMFLPLEVRAMHLENRVVVSPMCMYSAEDGTPNDWHLVHLGARALGGAGLVIAEMTDVSADARISPGCAGMYDEKHVPAWKRIVDFVHANSAAKIGLQLGHAGRKGATKRLWEGDGEPLEASAWPLLAPSPLPWKRGSQTPRAMTRDDMDRVTADYVRAAKMAERAGFDMLELHCAHGYLLSSFLTPLVNHRTDAYGGSLENRMRYPLEVFDAVRAAWPAGKPMSVRLSATDWVDEGGLTDDDTVVIARVLAEHGADLIDLSSGQTTPDAKPQFGRLWQTRFSDRVRNEVGVRTMAVGAISSWDDANSVIAAGRADLCVLARAHLADPHFTLHAAAAQGYEGVRWPPQYLLARPPPRAR